MSKQLVLRLLSKVYDDKELLDYVRSQFIDSEEIDSIWRIYGEDYGGLKKEFLELIESDKLKCSFDLLIKKLKTISVENTEKFGYFFSPVSYPIGITKVLITLYNSGLTLIMLSPYIILI